MATLVSELIARLRDGVSGPARTAGRSLDTLAQKGNRRGGLFGKISAGATEAAGALGLVGGAAAGALLAKKSYLDAAAFNRRMERVGITADATSQQVKAATADIRKVAQETALPLDKVIEGVESLVASGRSLPEATRFVSAVGRAAQASGAEVADLASTADTLATSFGIPAEKAIEAFDALAASGKQGKFELKDMAQYYPSLGAQASAAGLKGLEGLKRLAAYSQIVRTQTGTASEAATSLSNVFAKGTSQETVKRFKKMGLDLTKAYKDGKAAGEDMITTLVKATLKATKGDLSKIPLLFNDLEFARGIRALASQWGELPKYMEAANNSAGTVARDLKRVTGDAQAGLDRLANSFAQAMVSMGGALDSAGVTKGLQDISAAITSTSQALDDLTVRMKQGPLGFMDAIDDANKRSENDSKAVGWFSSNPFRDKDNALLDEYRRGRPKNTAYDAARAEVEYNHRYFADMADGGGPQNDEQRAEYARRQGIGAKAQAEIDRQDAEYAQRRGGILKELSDRADQRWKASFGDRPQGRTKDDAVRGYYSDGKAVLGPPMPSRAAPGAPATGALLPPPRPSEIAVQADASQVSSAAQEVDNLNAKIQATTGQTVTVTAQPQGMAGVISDLDAIIARINSINSSTIRTPSGGSGSGAYSDRGIGH